MWNIDVCLEFVQNASSFITRWRDYCTPVPSSFIPLVCRWQKASIQVEICCFLPPHPAPEVFGTQCYQSLGPKEALSEAKASWGWSAERELVASMLLESTAPWSYGERLVPRGAGKDWVLGKSSSGLKSQKAPRVDWHALQIHHQHCTGPAEAENEQEI